MKRNCHSYAGIRKIHKSIIGEPTTKEVNPFEVNTQCIPAFDRLITFGDQDVSRIIKKTDENDQLDDSDIEINCQIEKSLSSNKSKNQTVEFEFNTQKSGLLEKPISDKDPSSNLESNYVTVGIGSRGRRTKDSMFDSSHKMSIFNNTTKDATDGVSNY
jgi:hypothetical protein